MWHICSIQNHVPDAMCTTFECITNKLLPIGSKIKYMGFPNYVFGDKSTQRRVIPTDF